VAVPHRSPCFCAIIFFFYFGWIRSFRPCLFPDYYLSRFIPGFSRPFSPGATGLRGRVLPFFFFAVWLGLFLGSRIVFSCTIPLLTKPLFFLFRSLFSFVPLALGFISFLISNLFLTLPRDSCVVHPRSLFVVVSLWDLPPVAFLFSAHQPVFFFTGTPSFVYFFRLVKSSAYPIFFSSY